MTDTERLDLIDYYKWELTRPKEYDDSWCIHGEWGYVMGSTIRKAIDYALAAQITLTVAELGNVDDSEEMN